MPPFAAPVYMYSGMYNTCRVVIMVSGNVGAVLCTTDKDTVSERKCAQDKDGEIMRPIMN